MFGRKVLSVVDVACGEKPDRGRLVSIKNCRSKSAAVNGTGIDIEPVGALMWITAGDRRVAVYDQPPESFVA